MKQSAFTRKLGRVLAVVGLGFGAAVPMAHAALPEGVTTAITTAQGDLVSLLTALTSAGLVVFVARVIYRYFKLR